MRQVGSCGKWGCTATLGVLEPDELAHLNNLEHWAALEHMEGPCAAAHTDMIMRLVRGGRADSLEKTPNQRVRGADWCHRYMPKPLNSFCAPYLQRARTLSMPEWEYWGAGADHLQRHLQ